MPRPEVTRTSGFNSFKISSRSVPADIAQMYRSRGIDVPQPRHMSDQFIGHFMRHRNQDIAVCAPLYRIGNIFGVYDGHLRECFPHRAGIEMYATVHDKNWHPMSPFSRENPWTLFTPRFVTYFLS